ncbi:MAG: polysaccharide biosynthesis protein, partial [Bacteroidales bacterium]|nr:polysaccharide biosynthesis protein [Bacteroidales bacterium]
MVKNLIYTFVSNALKNHPPRWVILAIDLFLIIVSLWAAFFVRLNFQWSQINEQNLVLIFPVVLSVRLIFILVLKSYAGIIRYSTVEDLQRVITVIILGSLVFVAINIIHFTFGEGYNFIPYGVVVIEFLLSIFFLILFRLLVKSIYIEVTPYRKGGAGIIIYGTGEFANLTSKSLRMNNGTRNSIIAFVDGGDSNNCYGNYLAGVKIHALEDLAYLVNKYSVEKLVIAKENIKQQEKEKLIFKCLDLSVKVLTIPKADDWINGEFTLGQGREINIEDLLERPVIKLDKAAVRAQVSGKTILVTGAAGSIGSELVRQICGYDPKLVVLYDQAETALHSFKLELEERPGRCNFEVALGDVYNESRLTNIFSNFKPHIVFHAAAYKHVPMLEDNPKEAMRTNIMGTKILADLSARFGVENFIMISTDKAVRPTSIMGASKRISEMYIQSLNSQTDVNTAFTTTRFGNVLGSNGSVVERFMEQIRKGEEITVTHPDMQRYFMTIPEAVQLVMEAAAMGEGGEIFVFDMGKMVRIVDLAERMVRLSGLVP